MFDFAWSEILVIGIVALVVIGPKDLPRVMRTVGVWMGRARAVAREFQSSLDQMVREAELEDVRKQVEDAAKLDLKRELENSIDPGGDLQRSLSEPLSVEPPLAAAKPETPAAELPPPAAAVAEPPEPAKTDTHA